MNAGYRLCLVAAVAVFLSVASGCGVKKCTTDDDCDLINQGTCDVATGTCSLAPGGGRGDPTVPRTDAGTGGVAIDPGAETGDTCDVPEPLREGTTNFLDWSSFGADHSRAFAESVPPCSPYAGAERVFSFSVPPSMLALVSARREGASTARPVLNLLLDEAGACEASPPTCVGGAPAMAPGQDSSFAWYNPGPTPRRVLLVVGAESEGSFSLWLRVQTP